MITDHQRKDLEEQRKHHSFCAVQYNALHHEYGKKYDNEIRKIKAIDEELKQ